MDNYTFRAIIEPDENKTFHGFVPILPGCHTFGDTIEQTKRNLREAITCHIQGLLKDKLPIPQENDTLELIQTFSKKEVALSC
ncbi:type II toxin-antitoxin system HicB family antitoxin [Candidatus Gribaldobacteria bacterium]|nr:type II toxin-antitoxin system HicB family antitoxin [Candidatus Gribaldobacteria bacterium]